MLSKKNNKATMCQARRAARARAKTKANQLTKWINLSKKQRKNHTQWTKCSKTLTL